MDDPARPADVQELRPSTGAVRLLDGLVVVASVSAAVVAVALIRGWLLVAVLAAIGIVDAVSIGLIQLAFASPLVRLDDHGIVVRGMGFVPWRDLDRVIVAPGARAGRWVGLVLHDTTAFAESRRAASAELPWVARLIASVSRGSHRLNRSMFGADVFIPVGAGSAQALVDAIEARRPITGRPVVRP